MHDDGFSLGRFGRAKPTRRDGPIWSKPPRWRFFFVSSLCFFSLLLMLTLNSPHSTGLRVSFGGREGGGKREIPLYSALLRPPEPPPYLTLTLCLLLSPIFLFICGFRMRGEAKRARRDSRVVEPFRSRYRSVIWSREGHGVVGFLLYK